MKYKRIFVIVMDSLGCGEAPKSGEYNDLGANTLRHLSDAKPDIKIPTLESMGIGNICDCKNIKTTPNPTAYYGKMDELSVGKDTMTGHWEMMGLEITEPFIAFTDTGFPKELIDELERKTNRHVVGNYSASGTEIIKVLGEHQMKTGDLIVYTSADSVLQIAAHEDIIPVNELYKICEIARDITMKKEWKVGRIIARPYIGFDKDHFVRTANRHDYALKPFEKTVLNSLKDAKYDVISIGKINDIFCGEGITNANRTTSNHDGMMKTIDVAKTDFTGLCFVNLVDFDATYGHRRNPVGYAECLEEFDKDLKELLPNLGSDDLLILTADHGNDPIHHGTDHTREYVPIIIYNKDFKHPSKLETAKTFANIGQTIASNFGVEKSKIGESLLDKLL